MRDNILFGKPLDEQKYRATLEACCLIGETLSLVLRLPHSVGMLRMQRI